jgi:menaquinone-specific isochorismate synthase
MFDHDAVLTTDEMDTAEDVRAVLVRGLRVALRQPADDGQAVRVAVPLRVSQGDGAAPASADASAPLLDPLHWLHAQAPTAHTDAAFWSGREDDGALAAVGAAATVAQTRQPVDYGALERDVAALRLDDGARLLGGLRFDARQGPAPDRPDDAWQPFATARFVLPRFELRSTAPGLVLAAHVVPSRDAARAGDLVRAARGLVFPATPPARAPLPGVRRRHDVPDHDGWTRAVRWALEAFAEGNLQKVVLARRVALRFGAPLDPLALLRRLRPATPGCFHFGFRPAGGHATFLGATPERLFRLTGRTVESEAVAGTRERGASARADVALRDELMASEKDRREHAFVQDAIRAHLGRLCTAVEESAPQPMTLTRKRHLHARLRGTLRPEASAIDVLRALHPTPAVGGEPTDAALTAIRAREAFDRGWYAGPVGWLGAEDAELAVALRCGLVHGDTLRLFSGAGLVAGSDPEAEWDEIEQKLGDFAAVLRAVRA